MIQSELPAHVHHIMYAKRKRRRRKLLRFACRITLLEMRKGRQSKKGE